MFPRIVLVDDDEVLLQALPGLLQSRLPNVEVETYPNARGALDRLKELPPAMIICDLRMPDMDGLAFLAEARKCCPQTPFLLISGHLDITLSAEAMRAGAYGVLPKPIDRETFVACLKRALQERVGTAPSHRLLLVDDNPGGALALHDALELKLPGLRVDTVTSAEEGVAMLTQHHYDCAISDVLLPGKMDGLDFMRGAQRHDPVLPVILITAGEFLREEEALREGAFAFLPKPLDIGLILRTVRRALHRTGVVRDSRET